MFAYVLEIACPFIDFTEGKLEELISTIEA